MTKKRKYPVIDPVFIKNASGKPDTVYLPYNVFESIFEEMGDLKKQLTSLKKQSQPKKAKKRVSSQKS